MVDSPSHVQRTEMEYDSFLKGALDKEVKKFHRDTKRQMKKQTLFSEMNEEDVAALADKSAGEAYDLVGSEFRVLQYSVAVRDALLYNALTQIDERARNIILMAHWLEMSDLEIADETGVPRRTVNDVKHKAYAKLRKILEGNGHDANTFFPKKA
ncbi:MAG: sigma-70 family RNA polymerase sigma factor [Gracilibacteraceae bacterium]|jgi:RNA polymerase sigma factor (sigma-70 family)|nr:sigma-70 family RNA polymerase sigma factor [Gracilibacteraceae bacterium]